MNSADCDGLYIRTNDTFVIDCTRNGYFRIRLVPRSKSMRVPFPYVAFLCSSQLALFVFLAKKYCRLKTMEGAIMKHKYRYWHPVRFNCAILAAEDNSCSRDLSCPGLSRPPYSCYRHVIVPTTNVFVMVGPLSNSSIYQGGWKSFDPRHGGDTWTSFMTCPVFECTRWACTSVKLGM